MEMIGEIAIRSVAAIAVVIAFTRIMGLRSFSKMSGYDFAITVAFGSVLAGAVTTLSTPLWVFLLAIAALFLVQKIISFGRVRSQNSADLMDNAPMLVMEHGEILEGNLQKSKMTKADLYGKLREANAIDISLVRAVVFEPTGDVSVLHKQSKDDAFSEVLLEGVRR